MRDGKAVTLTGDALARWKYQRYMQDYLACVQSVDDNVGRLLDFLKESGLERDTIVVYTSDQGFFLGDHGLFDKRFMYEESLRIPLLVRWPAVVRAGLARGCAGPQRRLRADLPGGGRGGGARRRCRAAASCRCCAASFPPTGAAPSTTATTTTPATTTRAPTTACGPPPTSSSTTGRSGSGSSSTCARTRRSSGTSTASRDRKPSPPSSRRRSAAARRAAGRRPLRPRAAARRSGRDGRGAARSLARPRVHGDSGRLGPRRRAAAHQPVDGQRRQDQGRAPQDRARPRAGDRPQRVAAPNAPAAASQAARFGRRSDRGAAGRGAPASRRDRPRAVAVVEIRIMNVNTSTRPLWKFISTSPLTSRLVETSAITGVPRRESPAERARKEHRRAPGRSAARPAAGSSR